MKKLIYGISILSMVLATVFISEAVSYGNNPLSANAQTPRYGTDGYKPKSTYRPPSGYSSHGYGPRTHTIRVRHTYWVKVKRTRWVTKTVKIYPRYKWVYKRVRVKYYPRYNTRKHYGPPKTDSYAPTPKTY